MPYPSFGTHPGLGPAGTCFHLVDDDFEERIRLLGHGLALVAHHHYAQTQCWMPIALARSSELVGYLLGEFDVAVAGSSFLLGRETH